MPIGWMLGNLSSPKVAAIEGKTSTRTEGFHLTFNSF